MKRYNERLLNATKKISQETLVKSNQTIYKLTHPPQRVVKIGSAIGTSIGFCLVAVGTIAAIGGGLWGVGSCLAGVLTIASNFISKKK